MNALGRFHRWLDSLSERTKIVGLVAVIVAVPALIVGVALLAGASGHSPSWDAGRGYGEGLVAEAERRYSADFVDQAVGSAVGLCGSVAVGPSFEGDDPEYDRDEWIAGCKSVSESTSSTASSSDADDSQPIQRSDIFRPDGSAVPPDQEAAYLQGREFGSELHATLAQAKAAEDVYAGICGGWVDNALKDGYITWPSPAVGGPFTAELEFEASDHDMAEAFANGCSDAAAYQVPEQPEVGNPGSNDRSSPDEIVLPDDWTHDPESYAAQPDLISSGSSHWYDSLVWSGWGSNRAIGKGLEHSSDCTPSCANGTVSSTPVTIVASNPGECRGRTYYLAIRIERANGKAQSIRFRSQGFCAEAPANPFYDATVREGGMAESELEAFFQRSAENGRTFARDYGNYAGALEACSRLVSGVTSGEIVPPQVAALSTLEQQVVALAALAQVAAQGCNYGVGAQLSGG